MPGLNQDDVAILLIDYASLLRKMNRVVEAAEMQARAKAIRDANAPPQELKP